MLSPRDSSGLSSQEDLDQLHSIVNPMKHKLSEDDSPDTGSSPKQYDYFFVLTSLSAVI
jgi:hypothetical protein